MGALTMFFSEVNAAWAAFFISACAFVLSLYTLAQNRNSVSLYLGYDQDGDFIGITNNSPHAVTIVDMGVVRGDGACVSVLREDSMSLRVDPRDIKYRYIPQDSSILYFSRKKLGRVACYVKLATDHSFYSISKAVRWSWWIRGWFDGVHRKVRMRRDKFKL